MTLITSDIISFRSSLPPSGRLIACDHGEKRIGIATSDDQRTVATPHDTFSVSPSLSQNFQELQKNLTPAGFVVGLPLHMNGQESPQSSKTRTFTDFLATLFPSLPFLLFDERLSTASIERMLVQEADLSRQKRRHHRDKLAACLILQAVLDALRIAS